MNSLSNESQSYYSEVGPPNSWQPPPPADTFEPTAVQLQRAEELKRFNRLAIYLPVGLLTVAAIGLFIYLLIVAIWPPFEDTRLFLSGVADIILIFFMLPVLLIFGLLLAGIIGGAIYWRQSRKEEGETLRNTYGRLRLLLWKLDQRLSGVYGQVDKQIPKLANPVIRFNETIMYINTRLARLMDRSPNQ
ncbi:hypothetical protein [Candidatus Leptofilum sp.]|uniref:hypothetical protein n=1 Tax=Candidatus Leptofilum sp. TaxID=3241576 RepID=UPI003B5ABBDD